MALDLPIWSPSFGNGPPGANVPHQFPYFDTSTANFTAYIWNAGAWHNFGPGAGVNATSIQGVGVTGPATVNGQKLKYNGSDYAPT